MRPEVWIPALVAILSFLGSIYSYFAQRRLIAAQALKTKSEANKTDVESINIGADASIKIGSAWEKLAMNYKTEIAELKAEIARLNRKVDRLERRSELYDEVFAGAHQLHKQVVDNKMIPVYIPPERRLSEGDL